MPHYQKPPITEAIIDLRASSSAPLESILDLHGSEIERYPSKAIITDTVGVQVEVNVSAASVLPKSEQTGVRFTSGDGKYVWQSRKSGFTFSRLTPYLNWMSFRTEGRRLWEIHRNALNPDSIHRLAVRYINRIDIPHENFSLNDYFLTGPELGKTMPEGMIGFFTQLKLDLREAPGTLALINQAIVPPFRPGVTSVVLDIDLFRESDVPQTEAGIWNFFDSLREWKNRIFEASITDKSRELFTQ